MATATVAAAYKDATNAYLTARVAEGGALGNVEYGPASTPLLNPDTTAKPLAQIKTELTAAVKALRDAQLATTQAVAISGTVTV